MAALVIRATAEGGLEIGTAAGSLRLDAGQVEQLLDHLLAQRGLSPEPPRCPLSRS